MAYIDILDNCVHSIGGIKDFKIATKNTTGGTINFPLDINFKVGSTDTVLISEDFDNRIITIGGVNIEYRYVYPKSCTYQEDEIDDRQGNFFRKTLQWNMPKVNPTTQNQLKDFLFNSGGEFATSNAIVFFTDGNNQNWFGSIDLPFILENFDLTTDTKNGDNHYTLRYVSQSYMRTLKYELI